jgi:uncharacterized membrane protein YgcG
MTGSGRRFDHAELTNDPALTEAEMVAATAIARDLEAIAERDDAPTVGFSDKVMTAIAAEPTPKPTRVFGASLRAGRFGTAVAAIRDAWRVAFGGGRPFAVRGQALALVLIVLIGALGVGGGAVVGASRLLNPDAVPQPSPSPTIPPPSPSPSPAPSLEPSPTPAPSPSPTDTDEPTDLAEPTETDDSGGNSGPGGGSGSGSDDSGSGSNSGSSGSSGSGSDDSGPDDSGSGTSGRSGSDDAG